MLTEFDRVGMSAEARDAAIALDTLALGALASSKAVRSLKDRSVTDKMMNDCYAANQEDEMVAVDYLESLQLEEALGVSDYAALVRFADDVVQNTKTRMEDNPGSPHIGPYNNSLGFVYVHTVSGDPTGKLKNSDSVTVDAARRFVLLADGISDNTDRQFINVEDVRSFTSPLNSAAVRLGQHPDALIEVSQLAVDDESIRTLQALTIVDIMTFAKRLPADYLDDLFDARPEDALDPHRMMTRALLSSLRSAGLLSDMIENLFEEAPRDEAGELVGEFAAHHRQIQGLAKSWQLLGDARNAIKIIATAAQKRYAEGIEHIGHESSQRRYNLGVAAGTFLNLVGGEFSLAPDTQNMMRVLSAEKWVQAVFDRRISPDPLLAKGATTDYLTVHHAIEQQEAARQVLLAQQEIAAIRERIDNIENKYIITARMLRQHGGLALRHEVEQWTDPGSNRAHFTRDQAQQLVGVALNHRSNPQYTEQLAEDLAQLRYAWADLAFVSGKPVQRTGLMRGLDTLSELYEAASDKQLDDKQLAPLWDLVRLSKRPVWKLSAEFAKLDFIQAFPPGEQDMIEDLVRISRGYEDERDPIEWQRIYSLAELGNDLERQGLAVVRHRLMQSAWHPLPHYVLEVTTADSTVAVVESPIYGNATYVVPDAEWKEIVRFSKEEVRKDWGGIARVHSAATGPAEHREKIKALILASL